jgi:catechol 2,3-dioxygenase-like lactoylglutathione lyase family enzyme
MLEDKDTYASLPVTDIGRAKRFYSETLGLAVDRETEGGIMFRSGSTHFFVYPSRFRPGGHTQMSWLVTDIESEVAALRSKGVKFEEIEAPGLEVEGGIVHSGPNVWTAWFKDPDGNMLGLTQVG